MNDCTSVLHSYLDDLVVSVNHVEAMCHKPAIKKKIQHIHYCIFPNLPLTLQTLPSRCYLHLWWCLYVSLFMASCKGPCQKLLSGFFPLRGRGYPPIPLSFFGQNDFPVAEKNCLVVFNGAPEAKECFALKICLKWNPYRDNLFNKIITWELWLMGLLGFRNCTPFKKEVDSEYKQKSFHQLPTPPQRLKVCEVIPVCLRPFFVF